MDILVNIFSRDQDPERSGSTSKRRGKSNFLFFGRQSMFRDLDAWEESCKPSDIKSTGESTRPDSVSTIRVRETKLPQLSTRPANNSTLKISKVM